MGAVKKNSVGSKIKYSKKILRCDLQINDKNYVKFLYNVRLEELGMCKTETEPFTSDIRTGTIIQTMIATNSKLYQP